MSVPLYEFSGEDTARPQWKWLIVVVVACAIVVAAVGGFLEWRRMRAERLLEESFDLRTGFPNGVVGTIAQVAEVREECLRLLARYPRLQVVNLSGTTAVSGGLRWLRQIDDLRVLSLRGCVWVDDEQAEWLSQLTGLKRLDLSDTRVSDATLRAIRELPRLSKLKFEHCPGITDAGLEICAEMMQLRELWPGGAGYSLAGLVALRQRRRDLSLQINPSDVLQIKPSDDLRPAGRYLSSNAPLDEGWEILKNRRPSLYAVVSTTEDIRALSELLRFNQDWGFGDRTQRSHGGYVEHIDQTWTSLELHGPAAVRSLATVFPLTPKLAELTLQDTTITTEEFPFELVPPGLRQLSIKNASVGESFLQVLSEHTALEQLSLSDVVVDGVDVVENTDTTADEFPVDLVLPGLRRLHIANAPVSESLVRVLSQHTALKELSLTDVAIDGVDPAKRDDTTLELMHVADVNVYGVGDERWTYVELRGPVAGRSLAKLFLLIPELGVLRLQETAIADEDFPVESVPAGLRRLHIENAQVGESFLRALSRHTALEDLSLSKVAVDSVDLTDPALGRFTTVRSMQLAEVKVDGVDLTDPALEPLTLRLRERLQQTSLFIGGERVEGYYFPRVTRTENPD